MNRGSLTQTARLSPANKSLGRHGSKFIEVLIPTIIGVERSPAQLLIGRLVREPSLHLASEAFDIPIEKLQRVNQHWPGYLFCCCFWTAQLSERKRGKAGKQVDFDVQITDC